MNLAREVILWLESKTSFVAGTSLFQGVFQVGNEEGVAIVELGGNENESLLRQVIIHITVQGKDYDTANDDIQTVWNLLSFSNGMTLLNGKEVFNSTALKYPSFIAVTEHNKYMFTASVTLHFER